MDKLLPNIIISAVLFIFFISTSNAQTKYWIFFSDKGDYQSKHPKEVLSPEALSNRHLQGISLDAYDFPIEKMYVDSLHRLGIHMINHSRWLNAVSAYIPESKISTLKEISFIHSISAVKRWATTSSMSEDCDDLQVQADHLTQLHMVGLDSLHGLGFTGKGVRIAMFDNGFLKADQIEAFSHVFDQQRIIATRDFVDGDNDVFEACDAPNHCQHGEAVWSVIAAYQPGTIMGSAPDANFILLRTENDRSETPQEEDNWVAAAEFADSLGAQVFSTSLGYFEYDNILDSYTNADLNGETAIISRAASIAASRGIVVVNSAGNSGTRGLSAPADAKGIISVGSVNACEEISPFSSQGPTADSRIKPDVVALGEGTFFLNSDGRIRVGNGTSLSCPIISGMMACLIQAEPLVSAEDWIDIIHQSSDRASSPDNIFGYGIPSASQALILAREVAENQSTLPQFSDGERMILFPNPLISELDNLQLAIHQASSAFEASIRITDIHGKIIIEIPTVVNLQAHLLTFDLRLNPGMYVVELLNMNQKNQYAHEKLIVLP